MIAQYHLGNLGRSHKGLAFGDRYDMLLAGIWE